MTVYEMLAVLGTSYNAAKQVREALKARAKQAGVSSAIRDLDNVLAFLGAAQRELKVEAYDEHQGFVSKHGGGS